MAQKMHICIYLTAYIEPSFVIPICQEKSMNASNCSPLTLPDGRQVEAQAPVIVSASRSTDIPAFFTDWFFTRLKEGYSLWKNPFNGKSMYISYAHTRFIVFWSKNPRPLLPRLDELKRRNIGCYVQYTLNDYCAEGFEKNVPCVEERLDTFLALAEKLGKSGVIWRNDPLLLTDTLGMDELLKKAERIGNALCGHTEKLVFSFADITPRVAANLKREGIRWQDWTMKNMEDFTAALARLNEKWGFDLATCAEAADLQRFGVSHNRCVDDTLIIRRAYADRELMNHLNVSIRRESSGLLCPVPLPAGAVRLENGLYAVRSKHLLDKGQREHCGCVKSKDIGEYSTCMHLCSYCYANAGERTVLTKYAEHRRKSGAESISGQL